MSFFYKYLFCLFSLIRVAYATQAPVIKLYAAPKGEPLSKNYKVLVNGRPLAIYDAKIGAADDRKRFLAVDDLLHSDQYYDTAAFGYFELEGSATITVTIDKPILEVKVLPSSKKIKTVVKGKSVSFVVNRPQNLTVEINGEFVRSLHLFVNPKSTDIINWAF